MDSSRRHLAAAVALGLGLLAVLAGCGSSPDKSPVVVLHDATIATVADLTTPAEADVVLTFERADGRSVQLSIAQLEDLKTVSATLYEPFLDKRVTFQGVPLRDLFDFLQIPASVTTLHTVALNEYAVDLPVSVANSPEAILATRAGGELIPVDQGGPTRVVFTDGHPQAGDESLWVWSLKTVSIP